MVAATATRRWSSTPVARTAELPLFDIGLDDTAYPFLLFLSQAETESLLNDHLSERSSSSDAASN